MSHHHSYDSGVSGWKVLLILGVLIGFGIWIGSCLSNRVDSAIAIEQTELLTGKKVVQTVRSSNTNLIFGSAWDATWQFHLDDGTYVSTRCWGEDFSQPICRVYSAGQE